MVKKSTIVFNALLLLLITATIPYFAYGVTAIRTGYEVVGGLNTSGAVSGGIIGTRFSHFKDVIATVLFLYLFIINKKKKYLGSI